MQAVVLETKSNHDGNSHLDRIPISQLTVPTDSQFFKQLLFCPRISCVRHIFCVQPETDIFGLVLNWERQHTFFHEVSSFFRIDALIPGKLPVGLCHSGTCLFFLLKAKTRLHKTASKLYAANLTYNPGVGIYLQAVQMSHLACGCVEKNFRAIKLSLLAIYTLLLAIPFSILWSRFHGWNYRLLSRSNTFMLYVKWQRMSFCWLKSWMHRKRF